jgi:hypothetical protein
LADRKCQDQCPESHYGLPAIVLNYNISYHHSKHYNLLHPQKGTVHLSFFHSELSSPVHFLIFLHKYNSKTTKQNQTLALHRMRNNLSILRCIYVYIYISFYTSSRFFCSNVPCLVAALVYELHSHMTSCHNLPLEQVPVYIRKAAMYCCTLCTCMTEDIFSVNILVDSAAGCCCMFDRWYIRYWLSVESERTFVSVDTLDLIGVERILTKFFGKMRFSFSQIAGRNPWHCASVAWSQTSPSKNFQSH